MTQHVKKDLICVNTSRRKKYVKFRQNLVSAVSTAENEWENEKTVMYDTKKGESTLRKLFNH